MGVRRGSPCESQHFACGTGNVTMTIPPAHLPRVRHAETITITGVDLSVVSPVPYADGEHSTTGTLTGANHASTDLAAAQASTGTATQDTKILTREAGDAGLLAHDRLQ
jgi:hypothetical protein